MKKQNTSLSAALKACRDLTEKERPTDEPAIVP
jgi:hypothetical protein